MYAKVDRTVLIYSLKKKKRTVLIYEFMTMKILMEMLTWDHVDWHTKRVLYEQLRWHFAEINTHPNTICFF